MRHVKTISVAKASDPVGAVFFQIWLGVFTWIISGAFSEGKS